MPTVRDILARKGTHVLLVGKDATVLQAALLMNEHKVGSLVVVDADRIAGMFTERDVLRRVVGEQRDPSRTCVGDVMTTDVLCCQLDTSLEEVGSVMKERRIRHLPVVGEEGRLLGLISIGDINAYYAASQEQTIFLLNEYLYGRV